MSTKGARRKRSPAFPYEDVGTCIRLVFELHKHAGFSFVPYADALEMMGLNPTSSTSRRTLSAMLSYALLVDEGTLSEKRVALSPLAKEMVAEPDAMLSVYREAVLSDRMMLEVWKEWGRTPPKDDDAVKGILESKFGFGDRASPRFTKVMRDNYRIAQLSEYYLPDKSESPPQPTLFREDRGTVSEQEQPHRAQQPVRRPDTYRPDFIEYPIILDNDQTGYLRIPREITQEDADFIPTYIATFLKRHVTG